MPRLLIADGGGGLRSAGGSEGGSEGGWRARTEVLVEEHAPGELPQPVQQLLVRVRRDAPAQFGKHVSNTCPPRDGPLLEAPACRTSQPMPNPTSAAAPCMIACPPARRLPCRCSRRGRAARRRWGAGAWRTAARPSSERGPACSCEATEVAAPVQVQPETKINLQRLGSCNIGDQALPKAGHWLGVGLHVAQKACHHVCYLVCYHVCHDVRVRVCLRGPCLLPACACPCVCVRVMRVHVHCPRCACVLPACACPCVRVRVVRVRTCGSHRSIRSTSRSTSMSTVRSTRAGFCTTSATCTTGLRSGWCTQIRRTSRAVLCQTT